MRAAISEADLSSITKEEVWALEAQAEQLCNELFNIYDPLLQKHDYRLVLEVFRIDFKLSAKKGIIKKLTKDEIFELGYYSGIDLAVTDRDGNVVEHNKAPLSKNIALWGCYKSFFKKRCVINRASKQELGALIEAAIIEDAKLLGIEL